MKKLLLLILTALVISCNQQKEKGKTLDVAAYTQEVEQWHLKRVEELKGPKGWLNLAGLFWLKEGMNTVGSAVTSTINFPEEKFPPRAGYFMLEGGTVVFEAAAGITITSKGKPIKKLIAFQPDSVPPPMNYNSLEWFVIKRDNKYGVRLRDFESPALASFHGIDRFPVDPALRVEATYEAAPANRTIDITNVLGQTTPQSSPGTLLFSINSKSYKLDVIDEGGEDYFVIFGDSTNAHETYGAGRYMYVKKPDAVGKTILDFNKAYNPPCAFTAFATCPLPPKQNILPRGINAGEKNYGNH